jgi:hypothetical protein
MRGVGGDLGPSAVVKHTADAMMRPVAKVEQTVAKIE